MNKAVEELEKYRLFVGYLQEIPEDVEYSFYSSKRGYLFLFTKNEQPDGFVLLDHEHYDELSAEEKAWLGDAIARVGYEWLKANPPSDEEVLASFFDDVENRLKALREELIKGKDNERERDGEQGDDLSETS